MMMVEITTTPLAALPLEAFAAHLRLAEGFEAIPGQAERLENCLRGSIAALEARVGKALITRSFALRVTRWTSADSLTIPMAPVASIEAVKVVRGGGLEDVLPENSYSVQPDMHRPRLVSRAGAFPMLSGDASVEVTAAMGYGPSWDDVPAALQQAVMILAEVFFEEGLTRAAAGHELPCGVCLLVEPFREIRIGGGPC